MLFVGPRALVLTRGQLHLSLLLQPLYVVVPQRLLFSITVSFQMAWHDGVWWPIFVPQWWSPFYSQTPLDPYSLVHLQSGMILFYVIGFPIWKCCMKDEEKYSPLPTWYSSKCSKCSKSSPRFGSRQLFIGFVITFLLSLTFEIIENLPSTIEQYKTGLDSAYNGDSYQNIIGDLIVVQLGYLLAWVFFSMGVSWISAIWFLVSETTMILYMRDDGFFLLFNVFLKNQAIMDWQAEGVKLGKAYYNTTMNSSGI